MEPTTKYFGPHESSPRYTSLETLVKEARLIEEINNLPNDETIEEVKVWTYVTQIEPLEISYETEEEINVNYHNYTKALLLTKKKMRIDNCSFHSVNINITDFIPFKNYFHRLVNYRKEVYTILKNKNEIISQAKIELELEKLKKYEFPTKLLVASVIATLAMITFTVFFKFEVSDLSESWHIKMR